MTPIDKVRERWPEAIIYFYVGHGPYPYHVVFNRVGKWERLGEGGTEAEAWQDAAKKVEIERYLNRTW